MSQDPTQPQSIRLPDGREIALADIQNQRSNYRSHNLRDPRRNRTIRAPKSLLANESRLKYNLDDRVWMAQSTQEAIAARYRISIKQAGMMKYQSRYILDQLAIDYQDLPPT